MYFKNIHCSSFTPRTNFRVKRKRRDDNSLEWSNFCRPLNCSYSYNILVDQVHFGHDGRDTVALRFTERFDDGTPKSLRGPAADATATSR